MDHQRIKEIFLAAGFKLKEQDGGDMDLNAYVYTAAENLLREQAGDMYEGFAGQGRRLFDTCVQHGALPGNVHQWLKAKLAETCSPKFHGSMILEYPSDVFVLFDGTDDGSSILGAYRSLQQAQERQAFYARMENEGPGPDDPICFPNIKALQQVLTRIWWDGFNNGKGQATAGHSAGYEHVDCTSAVDAAILDLRKPAHD